MNKQLITKTLIKSYVDCQKGLYLELNNPELKHLKDDPFLSYLASEGYKFEDIVISLFPNANLQATFTSNGVLIRTDILTDDALIEVKSSTSVRSEDILDIAIQACILKETGNDPGVYKLAFVDNTYSLASGLDINRLVRFEDVTALVEEILPEVEDLIKNARKTANAKKSPKREVGRHCLSCPFIESCSPELLDYSIFHLRRGGKKIDDLLNEGVKHLKDITSSTNLSGYQELQVKASSIGDIINRESINATLNTLRYPIYYLDFEAAPILIPRYDGSSPYEQITFQVSIHIEESPGAELKHIEFLHDQDTDPRHDLAQFLDQNINEQGSIVVYHASYEKGRLQEIADKYPEYSTKMNDFISRLWDLETIFTKGHYISSKFNGSTSIKKVLPVLAPALSYQDLNISNGADAFISYLQMIDDNTTSRKKREIYNSLLQYCKMDTYAMYAIVEALREVCHE
tara:strand:+ start:171253 stop:172632 length:1380 start_codon:yes stop_codon:yes gene_type:complete